MAAKRIAYCGLFAALTAICAWLAIPIGDIAFTLQTFAVFLGLFTLGGRLGSIAFGVYLCLGAVGLPVFSGFQGGLGTLLGFTGGYLIGLFFGCLLYRMLEKAGISQIIAATAAMAMCYLWGTAWYFFAYTSGHIANLWAVIIKCVMPYLLPDALKLWLAYTLATRLKRAL